MPRRFEHETPPSQKERQSKRGRRSLKAMIVLATIGSTRRIRLLEQKVEALAAQTQTREIAIQPGPAGTQPVGAQVMTIAEFGTKYGVSRSTYNGLRRAGLGPVTMKLGRSVRIALKDADAWADRMKSGSEAGSDRKGGSTPRPQNSP